MVGIGLVIEITRRLHYLAINKSVWHSLGMAAKKSFPHVIEYAANRPLPSQANLHRRIERWNTSVSVSVSVSVSSRSRLARWLLPLTHQQSGPETCTYACHESRWDQFSACINNRQGAKRANLESQGTGCSIDQQSLPVKKEATADSRRQTAAVSFRGSAVRCAVVAVPHRRGTLTHLGATPPLIGGVAP